jgi:serine/threonine protein kinase
LDCIQCGTQLDGSLPRCAQCGWDANLIHEATAGYRPGELIRSRYEVQSSLGVGRLGTTLRVLDQEIGLEVALKVIHPALLPDEGAGQRFLSSMRPMTKIKHGSMARVFDVNCEGDRYFVVSQLVDGVILRNLMESRRVRGRIFAIGEVLPVVEQIVELLASGEGIVHGTLTPEKVWIPPRHIKIVDAGLAVHLPPAAVWYLMHTGGRSRGYVAPELERGGIPNQRSDVYSLGALVGEMLTQVAFNGRPQIFRESDPDLAPELDAILECALNAKPKNRYEDPASLLSALYDVTGKTSSSQDLSQSTKIELSPYADPGQSDERESAADWSKISGVPEPTMQVSMEDVIRSHVEQKTQTELPRPSNPIGKKRSPVPAPPKPAPKSSPLAANRPTDMSALAKHGMPTPTQPEFATPKATKSSPTPVSFAKPISAKKKPPVAPPPSKMRVEPRRPMPIPRDSRPPIAAPPVAHRADDSMEGAFQAHQRDVTQEIDFDEIESVESASARREVTQEIDLEMIESMEEGAGRAAGKLDEQAEVAERESADELIRRARRLDGVDPRFIRAAHTLESDRRGGRSKQAAELLRQRASDLDGVNPRFLRAAARLEEARVSQVSDFVVESEEDNKKAKEKEEDWRAQLEESTSGSVISFLAPPTIEKSADVQGFPRNQQRNRHRPLAPPPRPVTAHKRPAAAPRPREPSATPSARALYDDSGETDDDSQPTIQLRISQIPRPTRAVVKEQRTRKLEFVLPIAIGALFAAMLALLFLAFYQSSRQQRISSFIDQGDQLGDFVLGLRSEQRSRRLTTFEDYQSGD